MSGIQYIGSFPPPYGGVTVKNALLYKHLSERIDIDHIDMMDVKRFRVHEFVRFITALFSSKGKLVIGLSNDWRNRVTSLLYICNRKKMKNAVLFVMGGKIPEDKQSVAKLNEYRRVYVETESMLRGFKALGSRNVSVYPNCRERPHRPYSPRAAEGNLKCVYFSLISPEKGVDLVLGAAEKLPNVSFDFFGMIKEEYKETFNNRISKLKNAKYKGVFDSATSDVFAQMNRYDLHLFPTMYPNEGVPGVIVESKIASVPTIASNRCYNAELVNDQEDGLLTSRDSSEELAELISSLDTDRSKLNAMKQACATNAKAFYIDSYIEEIVRNIKQ